MSAANQPRAREPWRYQLRDTGACPPCNTDIPILATDEPGNTLRAGNIAYRGGQSSWKDRARARAGPNEIVYDGGDDADLIVVLTDGDQNDSGVQMRSRGGIRRAIPERGSLSPSVTFAPDTKPDVEAFEQRYQPPIETPQGDPRLVTVSNIQPGRVGIPCIFNVEATRAGKGNLEIVVNVAGRTLPNYVKTFARGVYEVSFTPQSADVHVIEVTFNGAHVPGSPFPVQVQYEASPPVMPVADVGSIVISPIKGNVVGKQATFQVDASRAGHGALSVEIFGMRTHPIVRLTPGSMRGIYEATFLPEEGGIHNIDASFNGIRIPGCPLKHNVINPREVIVQWESLQHASVQIPLTFGINLPSSSDDLPIEVTVTDCTSQRIPVQLNRAGNYAMTGSFVPIRVGKMVVSVLAYGEHVVGSPQTCFAYDASAVRIENVTQPGIVGREVSFTVDLTRAGKGNLEVHVTCMGQQINTFFQFIDDNHLRYFFIPIFPQDHYVTVLFNKEPIMNSALVLKVIDISGGMTGYAVNAVAPQQMYYPTIYSQGASFDPKLVIATVTAPNGSKVAARVVQQPTGDFKVDYTSPFTGTHRVDISYNGQPLKGSPFMVDIYDPSKIRIQGAKTGTVRKPMQFDIIESEAGPAKLEVSIRSPSGRVVPNSLARTVVGHACSYVPVEVGSHIIYVTYGGLEVPGMPLTHTIAADPSVQVLPTVPAPVPQNIPSTPVASPTSNSFNSVNSVANTVPTMPDMSTHVTNAVEASGEGLKLAAVGHLTKFRFSRVGQPQGRLHVHVDAPNSILSCKVESDPTTDGIYSVSYVPLEIGVHKVVIRWNEMDLEGSPFSVNVVDPLKVLPQDGWHSVLDDNGVLQLSLNELTEIPFSTKEAGIGELSAVVTDPHDSKVNVMVIRAADDNSQTIKFTPRIEGEYKIMVSYSGFQLLKDPVKAIAGPKAESSKVVVNGLNNRQYFANEKVEFEIDGTKGGLGKPEIKMHGIESDVDVSVMETAPNKYLCSFTPSSSGTYLLTVVWSKRQIPGSPFKVIILAKGDPSKVTVVAKDKTEAVAGLERSWTIDKRSAGLGQVTVTCTGPLGPALCNLKTNVDGTQTLSIVPEITGSYTLNVLFDGQNVPGSPFTFNVSPVGDASNVVVSGAGILDGVLAIYNSDFSVDTATAGLGQLTVRISGPKGAFRVELKRESPTDRVIKCHYDPTEVGLYSIDVQWSGVSVPGSPFAVNIFDTLEELEKFYRRYPERRPKFKSSTRAVQVFEH